MASTQTARGMRACLVVLMAVVSGCGGSGSPTTPAPAKNAFLALGTYEGKAELVRWANSPYVISYSWCYKFEVISPDRFLTVRQMVSTVIGPGGAVYSERADPFWPLQKQGGAIGGSLGCPIFFSDPDLVRPTALSYKMQIDLVYDDDPSGKVHTLISTGPFSIIDMPARPFVTALQITHALTPLSPALDEFGAKRPGPYTLTAVPTGGVPPHEFRWTVDGIVKRDWEAVPTWSWTPSLPDFVIRVDARSAGRTAVEHSKQIRVRVD